MFQRLAFVSSLSLSAPPIWGPLNRVLAKDQAACGFCRLGLVAGLQRLVQTSQLQPGVDTPYMTPTAQQFHKGQVRNASMLLL